LKGPPGRLYSPAQRFGPCPQSKLTDGWCEPFSASGLASHPTSSPNALPAAKQKSAFGFSREADANQDSELRRPLLRH